MTFGERIQLLRKRKKMSQEELGEKLEVTRQTVSKWELDQSTPDLDYIIAISEFFDVTTDYLIKGGKDEKAPLMSQGGAVPVPQLQYCGEDTEKQYDTPRYSPSPASAASASSDYFVIRLNYKRILKNLTALALMFAGGLGALFASVTFFQPYTGGFERLMLLILFLLSAGAFILGLSFYAKALLKIHEGVNKLCMKGGELADDFVEAFKTVRLERSRSVHGGNLADTDAYSEVGGEAAEEAFAAVKPDSALNIRSALKKSGGLILIVFAGISGYADIVSISHFYDGFNRDPIALIAELLFLLFALFLLFKGIGLLSSKKGITVTAEHTSAQETEGAAAQGRILKAKARESAKEEKILRIREKAEAKAKEERERHRLKAEALAHNSKAAERIIAKGEARAAMITAKAEKKIGRYKLGAGHKEKGAHLK